MPKIKRPIPESDQTVVRPIAIGVIQDILIDRLALPKDMTINYPGYSETVAQPHGFISNKYEPNRFTSTDKIFLDVSERVIEHLAGGNVVDHPEHIPIFLNRDLEVEMRPVYVSTEMTFNVRYRAKSKTEARRWFDYMKAKIPVKEDMWLHDIKYSFGFPEAFEVILKEIHRLTELQDGYGDTYEQFFEKWAHPRFGDLTDQTGKNTYRVFSDTQERCMGYFDIGVEPDFGDRKDDTDAWEVSFQYVLRYEKPVDVFFTYPIVIHNTVLSDRFRDRVGFERLQDRQEARTWSMAHLKSFEAMENVKRPYNDHPGRYFPLFDEFRPRNVPQNTMRVFTALILLPNEGDITQEPLMNIRDLEAPQFGFKLSDCILAFMKSEREYITTQRGSAMNLALYQGRNVLDGSFIRMDEDMNVYATTQLSRRRYYHLRLSIVTDFTYLTESAKTRLKAMPCAFENILEYILPEGSNIPPTKLVWNRVDDRWFDNLAEKLKGRNFFTQMKTVQYSTINGVYASNK